MPADSSRGWVVWRLATWLGYLRDQLDSTLGYSADYDATPEGDWTSAVAAVAQRVDEGMQIARDSMSPLTARGPALDQAVAPVVFRLPGAPSRYTVDVVTATTMDAGTLFRDSSAVSWKLVTGGTFSAGEAVEVEAVDNGPLTLSQAAPSTLTPITALVVPTNLTYTPGDAYSVGRDVEQDSALLRRWTASLGRPNGPTVAGIVRTLRAITWVTAASPNRNAPGELTIYIVPAPVGADREEQLAKAIARCVDASTVLNGSSTYDVVGPDGYTRTIAWEAGTTQAVDVDVVVTMRSGLALADYTEAIEQAVGSAFDQLEVGSTLYRNTIGALVWQIGAFETVNVLLDGGTSNITPTNPTDLLILGTLAVS